MTNTARTKLMAGEPAYGAWLNLNAPLAAEIMAAAGYDWLTVDAEHSAWDMPLIADTFRAIEAHDVVPFIRAWDHDPVTLNRLLDAGAMGIVIPHVSTPEEAEKLATAMRYPPVGKRSAGTGRIAVHGPDYRSTINDQVLVIPQIEDMEGVENAEAIMAVDGVDVGFIGPGDLSLNMGVEPGHPDHEAALMKILDACKKAGKPAGMPCRTVEAATKRREQGFTMLDIASDLRMLEVAAQDILTALRK